MDKFMKAQQKVHENFKKGSYNGRTLSNYVSFVWSHYAELKGLDAKLALHSILCLIKDCDYSAEEKVEALENFVLYALTDSLNNILPPPENNNEYFDDDDMW